MGENKDDIPNWDGNPNHLIPIRISGEIIGYYVIQPDFSERKEAK
jgi:hypothetical protein